MSRWFALGVVIAIILFVLWPSLMKMGKAISGYFGKELKEDKLDSDKSEDDTSK